MKHPTHYVELSHGHQRLKSVKGHSREYCLILEKHEVMNLIKWQEVGFIFDSLVPHKSDKMF